MFRRRERNILLRKSSEKMKPTKQGNKRLGNRYVQCSLYYPNSVNHEGVQIIVKFR